MMDLQRLEASLSALRPAVEAHVTEDRVRRYLTALADAPAPSTFAAAMRVPVLRRLLEEDGALSPGRLTLQADFGRTGSPVLLTGPEKTAKPLWFFAHLDTISYLVQPATGGRYPLVPFCAHMIRNGSRPARAYRHDLIRHRFDVIGQGQLLSEDGTPFFRPDGPDPSLRPGDRVVPFTPAREEAGGLFFGQTDNAGGVAALAVAAPVLAEAGIEAAIAFPDEEEGPPGSGNQMIGRGGTRLVNLLPTPELAIIADVQQAGGEADADARGGVANASRLGAGAVLAEFSSLGRGAVTPPDLYGLARHAAEVMTGLGTRIQESNNAYSSRSDDVSVMLKTPNILLLGFPGFNRHFDRGEPRAHLHDVLHLARALIYMAAIQPVFTARRRALLEGGA